MKRISYIYILVIFLSSCSSTKNIPDDDQLFVGLTGIEFKNYEKNKNASSTQEEIEAALATKPNGSLFGSSKYRNPFSYGLWIWNSFSQKEGKFAKWLTKSFGKQPVLMSNVNPALRASVAKSVLKNHGYFHGAVDYKTYTMKNPKKGKIGYTVDMGQLCLLDSISYIGYPAYADSLIAATLPDAEIHRGDAFTTASLDAERNRVSELFRNNGYYFYQPNYSSFLADTLSVPGKAQIRLQQVDDIPEDAVKQWRIGKIDISMRKSFMEELSDSFARGSFKIHFNGDKPPLRPRVLLGSMRLRPRRLFSYDNYQETISKINAMGLFSMVDYKFTPRVEVTDTTTNNYLDLTLNCVLDRPYDFYIETNFNSRTTGRIGPELKTGITRRNLFKGGEKLDVNLHGSYEWMSKSNSTSGSTYEYGMDASIEFPRIVAPFFGGNRVSRNADGTRRRLRRRRFYNTPTTIAKFSTDIIRRPDYYKMHIVSGEWTYRWMTSASSRHEFSPLTVKYQFMNTVTDNFMALMLENPFLLASMEDVCIPKMRYTYTYSSPKTKRNPVRWETTIEEAGNILSLGYMAAGKSWSEKDKELFKNPYSQYVRLETDFTKTWQLGLNSQLAAHVNAGAMWTYGNSMYGTFSEAFYVGGANSIRAFPIRSIGPGALSDSEIEKAFSSTDRQLIYLIRNGDVKFVGNLEYRHRLFGNLHGALFLDCGNVWNMRDTSFSGDLGETEEEFKELNIDDTFHLNKFFKQLAVGTGIGIRYDLEFLILRLDWGIGLHLPYETGKSGFYNMPSFKDSHTLHFAIGLPF